MSYWEAIAARPWRLVLCARLLDDTLALDRLAEERLLRGLS